MQAIATFLLFDKKAFFGYIYIIKVKGMSMAEFNNTNETNKVVNVTQFNEVKIRKNKQKQKNNDRLKIRNITIRTIKNKRIIKKNTLKLHFNVKSDNNPYHLNNKQLEAGALAKATKFVKDKYQKRKGFYQLLFVVVNILAIFAILIYQKNTLGVLSFKELLELDVNYRFVVYTFLIFALIMSLEGLRTNILIKNATGYNKPLLSYKTSAVARYYDSLIPIAGGKPFELFYLSTRGIKPSVATSVPLAKYIFHLIATIITSTVVIISKWSFLQENNKVVFWLGILMLIVNLSLVFFMVLFSVSKNLAPKLVLSFLILLEKLRLIKNHKTYFFKFMRFVLQYQKSLEYYLKSKKVGIISICYSLAISLLRALIPFLIYSIFAQPSVDLLLDLMSKFYILSIAVNFVPLPGAAGVTEFTFAALFKTYFTGGTLFWAIMLFRFVTYYMYLLQGVVVIIYDYFQSKKQIKKFTDVKIKQEA